MSAFENPERLAAIDAAMRERDARREAARILVKSANEKRAEWEEDHRIATEALRRLEESEDLLRDLAFDGGMGVFLDPVGRRR